jgi:hypothetical protein
MRSAAAALAGVVALAAPALHAATDSDRTYPISLVGVLGGDDDVTRAILVGRSGELYHPVTAEPDASGAAAGPRWQRQIAGGVSIDVAGAVHGPGGDTFVVGRRAPLFRFDPARGAWSAHPLPNRGPSEVCGPGGATCISLGRHVYLPAGARWDRLGSAADTINALWASTGSRVYVATRDGGLARLDGGRRTALTHPLAEGDLIVAFAGTPGRDLYALAASGTLLEVRGSSARAVTVPDDQAAVLGALEVHTLAPRAAGGVWVVAVAGPPEQRETMLLHAEGASLVRDQPAPDLAGDRAVALRIDQGGSMLLVSRRGRAWLRPAGGTFTAAEVLGTLPESAYRPSAAGAPAHTR